MVKKWSPLVWLAPSEKYLPMDVQEFLQHIVSQSRDGELHDTLPVGLKSESSFLVSNISLGIFKVFIDLTNLKKKLLIYNKCVSIFVT